MLFLPGHHINLLSGPFHQVFFAGHLFHISRVEAQAVELILVGLDFFLIVLLLADEVVVAVLQSQIMLHPVLVEKNHPHHKSQQGVDIFKARKMLSNFSDHKRSKLHRIGGLEL